MGVGIWQSGEITTWGKPLSHTRFLGLKYQACFLLSMCWLNTWTSAIYMGDMDLLLPDLVLAVVFEVLTIGWEISLSLSLSCLLSLAHSHSLALSCSLSLALSCSLYCVHICVCVCFSSKTN